MAIKKLKNKLIEMDKAEIIKMISEMYKGKESKNHKKKPFFL